MSLLLFSQPNSSVFPTALLFVLVTFSSSSSDLMEDDCTINNHPSIVSIWIRINGQHWLCGATLVHPMWVLCGYHCFIEKSTDKWHLYEIRAGSSLRPLTPNDEPLVVAGESPQTRNVSQWYTPDDPEFNNIAMIELDEAFELTDHIVPAKLPPPPSSSTPSRFCTKVLVVAWEENVVSTGKAGEWIRCLELPMVDASVCTSPGHIVGRTLCAKIDQPMDGCDGNSGGPIVCADQPDVLIGIGPREGNCGPGLMMTYTRVDAYLDWINEQLDPGEGKGTKQEMDPKLKLQGRAGTEKSSGHVVAAHVWLVVLLLINGIFF